MNEDITVTRTRQEKMDIAKRIDPELYPRAECQWCLHQWQPRKIKEKGSYYFCPICKHQEAKVWNTQKKLIGEPKLAKSELNKIGQPYKKEGKWYDKDGKIIDLFAESNMVEEEIDKSLQKGSHVVRKGIDSFPEFDSKTMIIVIAKAIENGYEEEDLHEFMLGLVNWYDAIKKIQLIVGKPLNPAEFPGEFEALIQMALESRAKNTEIEKLKRKIEGYDKARELLNVQLGVEDEALIKSVDEFNIDKELEELTNFGAE